MPQLYKKGKTVWAEIKAGEFAAIPSPEAAKQAGISLGGAKEMGADWKPKTTTGWDVEAATHAWGGQAAAPKPSPQAPAAAPTAPKGPETSALEFAREQTKATESMLKTWSEQMKKTQEPYLKAQEEYKGTREAQPGYLEQLRGFRQEFGLPGMEQELTKIDQTILDTEGLLVNLEADIKKRTEGLPVSEAALRRLTAMERAPLTKELTELVRGRARVAAGLEAKQANVQQFMTATQKDVEFKVETARDILDFARTGAEFEQGLLTKGFDTLAITQAAELSGFTTDLQEQWAEYRDRRARRETLEDWEKSKEWELESKKIDFENELFMQQLKIEAENQYPDYNVTTQTDATGNVTQVMTNKRTGEMQMIDLGPIGKGFKPTTPSPVKFQKLTIGGVGVGSFNPVTNQYVYEPAPDWFRSQWTEEEYGTPWVSPREGAVQSAWENYVSKQAIYEEPEKEEELDKWQLEQIGWQWLSTPEAQSLSDEEKAAQLMNTFGLNPEDFSLYTPW